MKKVIAVAAVIGLAVGLTWAAEQVGVWLGFAQQDSTVADDAPGNESAPGSEGVPPGTESIPPRSGGTATTAAPTGNEGVPPSNTRPVNAPAREEESPAQQELSTEVTSIEEDLARIEEALGSEEVLEEFTPSEPLSADNPVVWPTDI